MADRGARTDESRHGVLWDAPLPPPADRTPGLFVSPHGLAWAADGSLYVVEWLREGRVTKLVPAK